MRASWREGWGARASRCGALGLWLVACSAAEPGGSSGPVAPTPAQTTVSSASTASPAAFDSIPDLVKLAPKDAIAVIGVPSFDVLTRVIGKQTVDLGLEAIAPELAKLGLDSSAVQKALSAFDGGIVSIEKDRPMQPAFVVIMRVKDDAVIDMMVEAGKLEQKAPDRWAGKGTHIAWLAKAKVAIVSTTAERVDGALARASGTLPSFVDAGVYKPPAKNGIWLALDPSRLSTSEKVTSGSAVRLDLDVDTGALQAELILVGEQNPRYAKLIAPTAHELLGKLPAGAVGAASISMKRPAGISVADWIKENAKAPGEPSLEDLEGVLKKTANVGIADVERALGEELALGAYFESKTKLGDADLMKHGAVLAKLGIRDEKVARALVDAIGKLALGQKPQQGNLHFEKKGVTVDIKTSKDVITLGFGSAAVLSKLASSKSSLGSTPGFETTRKTGSAQASGLLYVDFPQLLAALPETLPANAPRIDPVLFVYQLRPHDRGIHHVLSSGAGLGAVATLGSVAAVSIYGVRRYLQATKTSEAKNTLGAIGRGAISAYEREAVPGSLLQEGERSTQLTHALCKSAVPVPATVPSGKRYQPGGGPGSDYETGSPLAGWKCLKFAITNPQYYQYDYRAGGNYKGPKRGLPDPGPNGFEASAEGDLDGDGKTSLFTLTGKVENGRVKLSTELHIADELE